MAFKQEDRVPEIVERSGVLRGRVPWYPGRDQPAAPPAIA
jgi:methylenetetrahydrofolate reductase (NADPH)